MNSLLARNLSKRSQTFVAKRFMSKSGAIPTGSTMEVNGTKVVGLNHMTTPSMRWAERQKYWLSDVATYPIIGILGGAGVFVAGFIVYFVTTSPDVQISPVKRSATIRNWN